MGSVKKYSRSNTYIKNNLTLKTMILYTIQNNESSCFNQASSNSFFSSILFLLDDKTTLAGSVRYNKGKVILGETHDNSQFPKFLVLDSPSGRKSLIEIEGKTRRKESIQKQLGALNFVI